MEFVDQTEYGKAGNCLTACVASLLDIPIAELPNHQGEDWLERWNEKLASYNAHLIEIADPEAVQPGYSILSGLSPRGKWLHAVICLDGKMVHDPHEDRTGIREGKRVDWMVLRPLDPSKLMGLNGEDGTTRPSRAVKC